LNVGLLLQCLGLSHKVYVSIILDKIHLRLRPEHVPERDSVMEMLGAIEYGKGREQFLAVECGADEATVVIGAGETVEPGEDSPVWILGKKLRLEDLLLEKAVISGTHAPIGILIMSGQGVKKNAHIGRVSVLDLTPTMLALLNLPVGRDMDGVVLTHALEEDYLRRHPVRYVDTHEEDGDGRHEREAVEEAVITESVLGDRLRALGYIE
jgi:hypothetical protein